MTSSIFSPQVIASIVAAIAAITAAVIATKAAKRQREAVRVERRIEYCRQQLNDLYGKLYTLRQASKSLYATLHPGGERPEGWRLVDHVSEIIAEGDTSKIGTVEEIIKINKAIEEILVSKSGLLDQFPPPGSFQEFVSHSRQLQVAWAKKSDLEGPKISFPRGLDQDIKESILTIRARISELDTKR
ncbi:hypothetical protein ACIPMW_09455 [Streptomyces sp. NPDC086669]|uniref:hypothetical protein n=1 Tax=Streptomyces sp. NPDC086669 TaxID=3365753 RepID=UPI003801CDAF